MDTGSGNEYRQPKGSDRSRIADRIRKAADDGRIGTADRDIRLGNVESAQSMAELDLISRDLDLLEEAVAPGAALNAPPTTGPPNVAIGGVDISGIPEGWHPPSNPAAGRAAGSGAKRVAVAVVAIVVIALVGAAGVAIFALSGSTQESSGTDTELPAPDPFETEEPAVDPEIDPEIDSEDPEQSAPASEAPKVPYALTAPGIRAYLAAYRAKFGTSRVVDLTMYDDYVIVRVPIAGKNRHAGWLYRPAGGWSDFGGVSANFPGSAVVDTNKIDLPALIRNIAKARRTLGVEDYDTTYVNVDYRPQFDDGPNVNIYVSNEFRESGYLATTLDGRVERSFPFAG